MLVANTTIINRKTGEKFANFYNEDSDYAGRVSKKRWKKAWNSFQDKPNKWLVTAAIKELNSKEESVEDDEDDF